MLNFVEFLSSRLLFLLFLRVLYFPFFDLYLLFYLLFCSFQGRNVTHHEYIDFFFIDSLLSAWHYVRVWMSVISILNMIVMWTVVPVVRSTFESYIYQGHFIGSCTLRMKNYCESFWFSIFFCDREKKIPSEKWVKLRTLMHIESIHWVVNSIMVTLFTIWPSMGQFVVDEKLHTLHINDKSDDDNNNNNRNRNINATASDGKKHKREIHI